jgi:hypothetical protein
MDATITIVQYQSLFVFDVHIWMHDFNRVNLDTHSRFVNFRTERKVVSRLKKNQVVAGEIYQPDFVEGMKYFVQYSEEVTGIAVTLKQQLWLCSPRAAWGNHSWFGNTKRNLFELLCASPSIYIIQMALVVNYDVLILPRKDSSFEDTLRMDEEQKLDVNVLKQHLLNVIGDLVNAGKLPETERTCIAANNYAGFFSLRWVVSTDEEAKAAFVYRVEDEGQNPRIPVAPVNIRGKQAVHTVNKLHILECTDAKGAMAGCMYQRQPVLQKPMQPRQLMPNDLNPADHAGQNAFTSNIYTIAISFIGARLEYYPTIYENPHLHDPGNETFSPGNIGGRPFRAQRSGYGYMYQLPSTVAFDPMFREAINDLKTAILPQSDQSGSGNFFCDLFDQAKVPVAPNRAGAQPMPLHCY